MLIPFGNSKPKYRRMVNTKRRAACSLQPTDTARGVRLGQMGIGYPAGRLRLSRSWCGPLVDMTARDAFPKRGESGLQLVANYIIGTDRHGAAFVVVVVKGQHLG